MRISRLGALTVATVLSLGAAACGGDDADEDASCESLLNAGADFSSALSGEEADFDDIADGFEELAGDAPDDLQGHAEVLAQAYREFADALGDVDLSDPGVFSDPAVQERFAEAGAIFDRAEVVEANENFTKFAEENCSAEG